MANDDRNEPSRFERISLILIGAMVGALFVAVFRLAALIVSIN